MKSIVFILILVSLIIFLSTLSNDVLAQTQEQGTELLPKPPEGYEWALNKILIGDEVYERAFIRPIPWWKEWARSIQVGGISGLLMLLGIVGNLWLKLRKIKSGSN